MSRGGTMYHTFFGDMVRHRVYNTGPLRTGGKVIRIKKVAYSRVTQLQNILDDLASSFAMSLGDQ